MSAVICALRESLSTNLAGDGPGQCISNVRQSGYTIRHLLDVQMLGLNVAFDEMLLCGVDAFLLRIDPGAAVECAAAPTVKRLGVSHPFLSVGVQGAVSRRAYRPLNANAPAAAGLRFARVWIGR